MRIVKCAGEHAAPRGDQWRPFFTNQRLVSEFAQVPVHVMSDRQPDQFQDI